METPDAHPTGNHGHGKCQLLPFVGRKLEFQPSRICLVRSPRFPLSVSQLFVKTTKHHRRFPRLHNRRKLIQNVFNGVVEGNKTEGPRGKNVTMMAGPHRRSKRLKKLARRPSRQKPMARGPKAFFSENINIESFTLGERPR